jgi:hypothetical protein
MGVDDQRHARAALTPGKKRGTHFPGGWVDPRLGLECVEKLAPTGSDPRTLQLVVSRYTPYLHRTHVNVYVL